MSSNKPTIYRNVLERRGIILSEDVYSFRNTENRVPECVETIMESLMNHNIQVPDSLRSLFDKEQEQSADTTNAMQYNVVPPAAAFFSVSHDSMIEATEKKFKQAAKLARIAREYNAAKVSRQTWEHFLRSYVFLGFEESDAQVSRHSGLFDAWTLMNNISWNAVSKLNQVSEDPPQPSFTYGFPVHVPDDFEKTPTGFNRNELVTNFSLNILADLEPIVTCPTAHPSASKARMTEGQPPERKDLICFPWALVEVQSPTEPVEACYCRAASGANAALDMQRQLQPVRAAAKDIPPVIFFTCSGPEILVWLSFLELKVPKPFTRCICIWAGTLTATWCIVFLREIVQNMEFWASRVLKLQIASRISQIRSTVSENRTYLHGTIPFRKTLSQEPRASEATNASQTEKPTLNFQIDLVSSPQKMFTFAPSSSAPVKTEKLHTEEDINTSRINKTISRLQRGLLSTEQKPSIIKPSDTTVKIKKATYAWYCGKRVPIRLPSNDERKPRRVTEADWDAKYYSWRGARQAVISGQADLVNKQTTSGSGKVVGDISAGQIDKVEGKKEADGKLGLEKTALDSSEGELETKKNHILDAETQGTHPGTSHTPANQSLEATDAGADGVDEVDDDSVGKYFVYKTNESFHARRYDAAIWDSDGDNDESYYASTSGSESDTEASNDIDFAEDDADDEGSESASSNNYEFASTEDLLSFSKIETEKVDSPSHSTRSPSGQVSNLTLDDIDDLLYNAANVISGEDFLRLKPIETLLGNLKGVDLLDATWRALENWEGQSPNLYSDQMSHLLETVGNLNDFVASQSENLVNFFKHHHLTMALRKDDLDQTLQRMQKNGDRRLRDLLKILLRSWDGEKCMELLSDELLELTPKDFDNMLQEAFDVVYSDANLFLTVR